MSQKTLDGLATSQTVEITVTAQQTAWRLQQLPSRPTAGDGVVKGMGQAAGVALGNPDPYSLLLLPILLPIGAAVGAASAPDDAEWALVERKYTNLRNGQTAIYREELKRSHSRTMERHLVDAFRAEPAASGKCIRSPNYRGVCGMREPVTRIAVHVMPEINNLGHSLSLRVKMQTPGGSDCFVLGSDLHYSREMALGATTPRAEADAIRRREAGVAKMLAYQLTEGWIQNDGQPRSDAERRARGRRLKELVDEAGYATFSDDAACS